MLVKTYHCDKCGKPIGEDRVGLGRTDSFVYDLDLCEECEKSYKLYTADADRRKEEYFADWFSTLNRKKKEPVEKV